MAFFQTEASHAEGVSQEIQDFTIWARVLNCVGGMIRNKRILGESAREASAKRQGSDAVQSGGGEVTGTLSGRLQPFIGQPRYRESNLVIIRQKRETTGPDS